MNVLKNNFVKFDKTNAIVVKEKECKSYPRKLMCENCRSELEYEETDMRMGEYGCMFVDCPLCGYDNMLEDNEKNITLTIDNIEFPIHFHHTSKDNAVDRCNLTEVRQDIKRAVEYFRKNKDEYIWYSWSGNLFVMVHRCSGDKEYAITVSGDFYSMNIPFEREDY